MIKDMFYVFLFITGYLLGVVAGRHETFTYDEIIEANCGYYDPQTREFKFGRLK